MKYYLVIKTTWNSNWSEEQVCILRAENLGTAEQYLEGMETVKDTQYPGQDSENLRLKEGIEYSRPERIRFDSIPEGLIWL